MAPPRPPTSTQFLRFVVVGSSNVAIDFVVYAALVLVGMGYVGAKLISFAVSTLNGYIWNRRWTFGPTPFDLASVVKYTTVQSAGGVVNLLLLALFIEVADVPPIPAQLLATPFVVAVTFVSNRQWTFAPREP